MFKILWPNFISFCFFSKLKELHCLKLITNLIFIFSIFFCYDFLLVCNYINKIYRFQKLNIFLIFKEVQISRTTILWSKLGKLVRNSSNIVICKIRLQLGKKLNLFLQRCERFGVCGMKTEHYLPAIAVYVIGIIVIVRRMHLFLYLL